MIKTILFSIAGLIAFSQSAFARESFSLNGSIQTSFPELNITMTSGPVANVKAFEVSIDEDAGPCLLTTDREIAKNSIRQGVTPYCYFKWGDDLSGLTASKLKAYGQFNTVGEKTIPFEVYLLANDTEYLLHQNTESIVVENPTPPVIEKVSAIWKSSTVDGKSQVTYDPSEILRNILVTVEERNYTQLFSIGGSKCEIDPGEAECALVINRDFRLEEQSNGQFSLVLNGGDLANFFSKSSENIDVSWDFRKPSIKGFAYNADPEMPISTVNVDGIDIALGSDQAVLVVDTPMIGTPGTWWIPANPIATAELSEGVVLTDRLEINGRRVRFTIPNFSSQERQTLDLDRPPVIQDDRILYYFSLSELSDGRYDLSFSVRDQFNKGEEATYKDNTLDRLAPDIKVLMDNYELSESRTTSLYFFSDLTIAAHGGWEDGTKITGITLNGEPVLVGAISDKLKTVIHNPTYEQNEEVTLSVTAEDNAGNASTKAFKFDYLPAEFKIYNKPDQLYARVQESDMFVAQTYGSRCIMADSDVLAVKVSNARRKGCTIEYPAMPDGMVSSFNGAYHFIKGAPSTEGEAQLEYKVVLHNSNGQTVTAYTGQESISVIEPPELDIVMSDFQKLEDGVYGLPFNSRTISRFDMMTPPAAVDININDSETDEVTNIPQRFGSKVYPLRQNIFRRLNQSNPKVYSEIDYKIDAEYKLDASISDSESFTVVVTPDSRTQISAKPSTKVTHSLDSITVDIQVGIYDRSIQGNNYIIDEMGEWDVHLASRSGAVYTPISPVFRTDANGAAQITLDASDLFEANAAYYAVATPVSEKYDLNKTIYSAPNYTVVLKGEAVEGEITSRVIEGKTPLRSIVYFTYKSLDDIRVAENLRWETSTDGTNWTSAPEHNGSNMFRVSLSDPQEMFVRARVENRITGVETISSELKLIAYDVTEVEISGPRQVYSGQEAEYKATLSDEDLLVSEGTFEWSIDDGQNWVTDDDTFTVTPTSKTKVMVRHRLNSTSDDIEDEGYTSSYMNVSVTNPLPLSLSMSLPYHAEAGDTITLNGIARNRNPQIVATIEYEWVTPNGTVMSGNNIEYTLLSDDINPDGADFTFRAWETGYKNETLSELKRSLRVWNYTFPTPNLTLSTQVAIAPSTVFANSSIPSAYTPDVEYTYEWVVDEDKIEIKVNQGKSAYLLIKESGMHTVTLRFSDNRGNSTDVTQFIDVIAADPMELKATIYTSNEYSRAPLGITFVASAKAGHPSDSPETYEWKINDVVSATEKSSYGRFEFKDPGTQKIELTVTSRMGQTQTYTHNIDVVPNENPTCSPEVIFNSSFVTVKSNCVDSDGRIIGIFYKWGDKQETSGSSSIRFGRIQYPSLDMTIRAVDDSGGQVSVDVTWSDPQN